MTRLQHIELDCRTRFSGNNRKTKLIKTYKGEEIVESPDRCEDTANKEEDYFYVDVKSYIFLGFP